MHQYAARANKIRVQVFDFEVIDCYRTFKQFVLYLFDYNPFSVYGDKNITCPKVYGGRSIQRDARPIVIGTPDLIRKRSANGGTPYRRGI